MLSFFSRGRKLALPLLFLTLTSFFLYAALSEVNFSEQVLVLAPVYYAIELACALLGLCVAFLSFKRHQYAGTFPSLFRSLGMEAFALFILASLLFTPESSNAVFMQLNGAVLAGAFIVVGAWTKKKPFTKPNYLAVFASFLFVLFLAGIFFYTAYSGNAPQMRFGDSFTELTKTYLLMFAVLLAFSGIGFLVRFIEEEEEIAFWTTLGLFSFAIAGLFFFLSQPFHAFWWVFEIFQLFGFLNLTVGSVFLYFTFAPSAVMRSR